MRKTAIALLIGASVLFVGAAASADPPTDPVPGADCSHGINTETCRPDPNENGQDCDEHGTTNPAGNDGNEDHCSTTTEPPVTTTTPPPTTTEPPVTTTTPPPTTTEPPVTTTTEPPVPTTTAPPTTTVPPVHVTKPPKPPQGGGAVLRGNKEPKGLAFTGSEDVLPLSALAFVLFVVGLGLLRRSARTE